MSTSHTLNAYNQSLELIERFALCLLKDYKTDKDLAAVKELESYIRYFSNESEINSRSDRIFENFVSSIDSATDKPNCDQIIREFHKEIETAEKEIHNNNSNEKCAEFSAMISKHISKDGEVETISETMNTIDPISKLPIVDPVKNKICGHTYDKTSVLQLIEKNPRTRCPIPGCTAVEFVRKCDLIPNNALKRILNNANSNSSKKLKMEK